MEDVAPIMDWNGETDDDDERSAAVVWWTRLDGRFQIEVVRLGVAYEAELRVFDHANGDKLVFSRGTPLAYDAPFGPDVSDVEIWQEDVLTFIDASFPPA